MTYYRSFSIPPEALECADLSALWFQPTLSAAEHHNGVALLKAAIGCRTPERFASPKYIPFVPQPLTPNSLTV